jgi:hypothetical protein
MNKKWLVAAGLVLASSVATVASARPMEPESTELAVSGDRMPPALREYYEQHPITDAAADALIARQEHFQPKPLGMDSGSRPNSPDAVYRWEVDHFDSVAVLNPLLWVLVDDLNDEDDGTPHWGTYKPAVSRCRAHTPPQSMWMFGGGADGENLACDADYPSGAQSSAIALMDLSTMFAETPDQFDMEFYYLLNLRTFDEAGVVPDGLFVNLIIDQPGVATRERVTLVALTSEFNERFFDRPRVIDFLAAQDVYNPDREPINILESGVVLLEFLALTQRPTAANPNPSTLPGGIFVDTIDFVSDREPSLPEGTPFDGSTSTPIPTVTLVPTEIPTITPTREATDTPETPDPTETPMVPPTDTPDPDQRFRIYMPFAALQFE